MGGAASVDSTVILAGVAGGAVLIAVVAGIACCVAVRRRRAAAEQAAIAEARRKRLHDPLAEMEQPAGARPWEEKEKRKPSRFQGLFGRKAKNVRSKKKSLVQADAPVWWRAADPHSASDSSSDADGAAPRAERSSDWTQPKASPFRSIGSYFPPTAARATARTSQLELRRLRRRQRSQWTRRLMFWKNETSDDDEIELEVPRARRYGKYPSSLRPTGIPAGMKQADRPKIRRYKALELPQEAGAATAVLSGALPYEQQKSRIAETKAYENMAHRTMFRPSNPLHSGASPLEPASAAASPGLRVTAGAYDLFQQVATVTPFDPHVLDSPRVSRRRREPPIAGRDAAASATESDDGCFTLPVPSTVHPLEVYPHMEQHPRRLPEDDDL